MGKTSYDTDYQASVGVGWGPRICTSNKSQMLLMLLLGDHILGTITLGPTLVRLGHVRSIYKFRNSR